MENPQPLNNLRHTTAHLLAAAVLNLWPDTKRAIGPAIESGFYYDFEFAKPISDQDLPKIEEEMKKILKTWNKTDRKEISNNSAIQQFNNEPYKLRLIEEFSKDGQKLTIYKNGDYEDLCKGGHSENPAKDIGAFKLLSIAGAYWRGNEKNKMLTRIYGTAFATKEQLDEYLLMLEEAKKRDHKKLGPQLELFMFHETAPGMPYWLPNGVIVYNELIKFWREEHNKKNYKEIVSPLVNKKDLYVTSGHFDHYWSDMFHFTTENKEEFALKAMNCPNAMIVFGSKTRSYRDLPLRFSDTDALHRNELSGTLNGLLRVREFRQDDAHCFVTNDQITQEYLNIFAMVERFYSIFNMQYSFRLGTRPENFMGDTETWNKAEQELKNILEKSKKPYSVLEGDGAFYGPKVDILMKDSLGREWQMGTIQLDFQQPKNFKLKYIDSNGKEQTPAAIHRVIYGSLERFIAILIEHYAGAFPLWIAPVQIKLLPIADRHIEYAEQVQKELLNANIRVEVDESSETLQAKIRSATLQKVPFMGIIGDKEIASHAVSVRTRAGENLGPQIVQNFLAKIKEDIDKKI